MTGKSDAELLLHLHHQTAKAFLVSDDGDEENAVWVPKSFTTCDDPEPEPGAAYTFTMAEWLAKEKELI